jgi:hypothetical protein
MKVFLSWSGNRSKAVAELFADWLPQVIQRLDPWISTEIEKGAQWLDELNSEMGKAGTGIVCLTRENRTAPWILFEAGALAKGLTQNRVCTFLVDLELKDVDKPLSQFQATLPKKDDVQALLATLNSRLSVPDKLTDERLTRSVEAFWPEFEAALQKILQTPDPVPAAQPRSMHEVLNDILETVRGLERKMGSANTRALDMYTALQHLDLSNRLKHEARSSKSKWSSLLRDRDPFDAHSQLMEKVTTARLFDRKIVQAMETLQEENALLRERLEERQIPNPASEGGAASPRAPTDDEKESETRENDHA